MKVFSGTSNKPLAQIIVKKLGLELTSVEVHTFPDGEKRIRITESVVGQDCIVVQSSGMPVEENYFELLLMVDSFKRSGAKHVTAVIPYMGYQRQDHVFRSGEARSFAVMAKMLEAVGVDKLVTIDLHSIKIPELFTIPVSHLTALPLFAEKIREILKGDHLGGVHSATSEVVLRLRHTSEVKTDGVVLVSPDMGGVHRVKKLSEMLGTVPCIIIQKDRNLETGEIAMALVQKNVEKTAIIVDDMVSTGETIVKAAELLLEKGAQDIFVFATHAVFAKASPQLLGRSPIKKIYVTDSVFVPEAKHFPKLEILSVADIIAEELQKF